MNYTNHLINEKCTDVLYIYPNPKSKWIYDFKGGRYCTSCNKQFKPIFEDTIVVIGKEDEETIVNKFTFNRGIYSGEHVIIYNPIVKE